MDRDHDFFILLNAGLGRKTTEKLSDNPDWDYIYTLACQQTVQGIIADGISHLITHSPHLNAPQEVLDRFTNDSVIIIRHNAVIANLQTRITTLLNTNNIKHLIVKGHEAARNYPNPHLRTSGDIDILLPPEDYKKAQPLLKAIADEEEPEETYLVHKGYTISGIEVELHGRLHPRLGKRIDCILDHAQDDLFTGKNDIITFNALYLFLHCLQHLHWSGLGLRQVIDWLMFMKRNQNEINDSRLQSDLRKMHLTKEWRLFLSLLDHSNPAFRARLWHFVRLSGNMGRNRTAKIPSPHFIIRCLGHLTGIISAYKQTRHITPILSRTMIFVRLRGLYDETRKNF